jgi:hypothetical protein
MENEARELGAFHRAAQWHGASQIKNLTRHDGHTWRIDFEEDFGELVPLPVVQALDIILFLNSVSLAGAVDEAESRRLLPRLLALCLEENPDVRVRATLLRARPWVARQRLSTPMRRRTVRGRQRKAHRGWRCWPMRWPPSPTGLDRGRRRGHLLQRRIAFGKNCAVMLRLLTGEKPSAYAACASLA